MSDKNTWTGANVTFSLLRVITLTVIRTEVSIVTDSPPSFSSRTTGLGTPRPSAPRSPETIHWNYREIWINIIINHSYVASHYLLDLFKLLLLTILVETKNIKSICTAPLHDFHKIWVKLGCLYGVGMPGIHSWLCQNCLKLKSWKILPTNLKGTF